MRIGIGGTAILATGEDAGEITALRRTAEAAIWEKDAAFKMYNIILEHCRRFGLNPNAPPVVQPTELALRDLIPELLEHGKGHTLRSDDPIHWTVTLAELEAFLSWDHTHRIPYIPNLWDCENYTELLRCRAALTGFNSVGRVQGWLGDVLHVWCFCITSDVGLVWIEPQAGAIIEIGEETPYRLDRGITEFRV